MKLTLVYVYAPHCGGDHELFYPYRFLDSYHKFKPPIDHQSLIVSNSGPIIPEMQDLFGTLPHCEYLQHDNSGYDIGAFQHAAQALDTDLILFLTASSYFCGANWLERIMASVSRHGDTLYGTMVNSGDIPMGVWSHIRTTGFWLSPKLMRAYPTRVTRADQRFEFEHKSRSLTQWVLARHLVPWLVTRDGEFPEPSWRLNHAGFQQGDQQALLIRDRYCDPPFYPVARR